MVKIKVYTTPTCPYCIELKDWLKDQNIAFDEIDISQNETAKEEMIEKSGEMRVPQIEINGKMIVGFEKEEIKKALKKNV